MILDQLHIEEYHDIKMFGSDLDGTYVDPCEKVPQINIKAFRFARKKKKQTALVTGRQFLTSEEIAKEAQVGYLGTENGGVLFERREGKYQVAYFEPIDFLLCCKVVEAVEKLSRMGVNVVYHLSTPELFLVRKGRLEEYWNVFYPQERLRSKKSEVFQFEDFAWDVQQKKVYKELVKICIDFGRKNLIVAGQFSEFLRELGLNFWETSPGKFEICSAGSSKRACIERIIKLEGRKGNIILPHEVAFFGDNWNDRDALEFCRGYLVSNAPADLKKELQGIYSIGDFSSGAVGQKVLSIVKGFSRRMTPEEVWEERARMRKSVSS